MDRISVDIHIKTPSHVHIEWEGDETWVAYQSTPGVNQRVRRPDLDRDFTRDVVQLVQDIFVQSDF
jgi:hypothetical protein